MKNSFNQPVGCVEQSETPAKAVGLRSAYPKPKKLRERMPMSTIEDLRKNRFQFLRLLYDKSGGNRRNVFIMWEIGKELGLSRDETESVTQYLHGENLLEHKTMGGGIVITHLGVREVEDALSHPEQPTQYFPPVNIINIHHMQGSQIQQGVTGSTQLGLFDCKNKGEIVEFVELLKMKLPDLRLGKEPESELNSDVLTLEAQLLSSRPKLSILKESMLSIQRILEGAAGAVVAQQLLSHMPALLGLLK
jgi:hypothetical protein